MVPISKGKFILRSAILACVIALAFWWFVPGPKGARHHRVPVRAGQEPGIAGAAGGTIRPAGAEGAADSAGPRIAGAIASAAASPEKAGPAGDEPSERVPQTREQSGAANTGWQPDAFGRVVLLAPRGASPAAGGARREEPGCSRSAAAKLSREFAGSGIDFSRPLPAGVSMPPPAPAFALVRAKAPRGGRGAQGMPAALAPAGPMAPITVAEVSGLTGASFVAAVLNSEDLDNSFFDITSADALAALAEARVQEIVSQLGSDLAADPLANAARIERGLYFLRAAAYVDSYSAALTYSAALKANVNSLLVAVGQNPQFLAAGFLAPRAEWAVVIDSWMVMPGQVTLITSLLRRYLDTPGLQDAGTATNRTEGTMMYSLLNGMARTANQDPNWVGHYTAGLMQALSDLALVLPDRSDIDFVILDAIYALGRLRAGEAVADYQGQAHQILSQVLTVRAVDSQPYLEAMMALELSPFNSRLASGAAVDIAGYRQQLTDRVFPNSFSFDGGAMVVRTPLDEATVQRLYDALREDKAQFFRVTQALRPTDDDPNASLTLRIYGTRGDYVAYQRFLYGLGTDNGGIYIENWATFFTYQRTAQESIFTLEELTRHEYIHYLDGYYELVPRFGDAPWYDNDRLTWHSEGLAEFLAGSRRTKGVPVRENQLNGATGSGSPMTISQVIGATYGSGFGFYPNAAMLFEFLHERHPELHWRYFRALYTNDMAAYDTLTQGWRSDAALQAEYTAYLTTVAGEVAAGTRLTAEDIPTDYRPGLLYGVTTAQIQADIQSRLPAGMVTASGGRFHFSGPLSATLAGADATTPERFQAEFGRQLDAVLDALTPVDAHYRCATAWFEQLSISGQTASATVHIESWFNENTAPSAVPDPAALVFDAIFSDDAPAQTLALKFTNTAPAPLLVQSVTLSGVDAGAFEVWWDPTASLSVAGRGAFSVQVSLREDQIGSLAPGTHTATLNFLTSNGTPALVAVPVSVTVARPLFVDRTAPAGGDGSSWQTAFRTISAAITAAPTGNEAILVAGGTYAEAVALRGSIHLYGGFSGLGGALESRVSERRPSLNVTAITGPALHVVDFSGTASALVDGFTITGGVATDADGGGVYVSAVTGTAVVRNCTIRSNQAGGSGGGVYVGGSAARLENCSILGNTADYGGGVAVGGEAGGLTVSLCWIAGNEATSAAGGLFAGGGQTLVEYGQITGNTANSAAGFEAEGAGCRLTLRGTLVAANVSRGWFGGGANYSQSLLEADQCVFFGNSAGPGYGFAGLGTVYGAATTLRNCIFAGHQDGEASGLGWGDSLGTMTALHCLFYGNAKDFTDGTHDALGASQLNALPGVFVNAFAADPRWKVAPAPAGTVSAAAYDAATRTTLLTLGGAALAPGSLRGLLISKGAGGAAAVLTNTDSTITVFGRHDIVAQWTGIQPFDFHPGAGSAAIDVGVATSPAVDADGFPRGVDMADVPNGPGAGFDLGLYEYRGGLAGGPTLRIDAAGRGLSVSYALFKEAKAGTLKLAFEKAGATTVVTVADGECGPGEHVFPLFPNLPGRFPQYVRRVAGPAFTDGTYNVTLSYQDALGNAESVAATADVAVDGVAGAPTLAAPAAGASKGPVGVDFTLPEAAQPGSVQLTFHRVNAGGTTLVLAASQETAGRHTFSFDPANPAGSPEIASGGALPDGDYDSVSLAYNDLAWNLAAAQLGGIFTIDTATQTPLLTAPAASAVAANPLRLAFTLPEAPLAGSVKVTFGNGTSSRVLTVAVASAGAHEITFDPADPAANAAIGAISGGPGIPDGTYAVTLAYQDALGNTAAAAVRTGVTVDATAPTIGAPAGGFLPGTFFAGKLGDYRSQAVVADNVGVTSVTQDPAAGTATLMGDVHVKLTARDAAGNTASTSFEVASRPVVAVTKALLATGNPAPAAGTAGGPPADALLTGFGVPAIDGTGTVAYTAKWRSPTAGVGRGLFAGKCLARVGDAAPGIPGAFYAAFKDPVMDESGSGRVAAVVRLSGVPEGAASGVVSFAADGTPTLVAQAGTVADADGAKFQGFKSVAVAGDVTAFLGQLVPDTGRPRVTPLTDIGVWARDGGGPLQLVLREGQQVGTRRIKTLVSFAGGNGSPGQGRGWLRLPAAGGAEVMARVVFSDGTQGIILVALADIAHPALLSQSGPVVDGGPGIAGASFAGFGVPAINAGGANGFLASMTAGVGGVTSADTKGIFLRPALTGSFAVVARTGAAAGSTGARFSTLKDPVLASDGGVAFPAAIAGGTVTGPATRTLWWQKPGGVPALVAQGGMRPGADLPATMQWDKFSSLAIAPGRGPVFVGTLVVGQGGVSEARSRGVWACDFTGAPRLLFRNGNTIDLGSGTVRRPRTLGGFELLNAAPGSTGVTRSINGAQKVVWRGSFTDGTQAIMVTEVP